MKKLLLAAILGSSLMLSGCMTTPSATQLSDAYYGELPSIYKGQIQNAIGDELKDPDSAKYKFGVPRKAYIQDGITNNFKIYYGWVVPVSFNAKNSYGAYVGYKTKYFMFVNGQMIDATLKFNSGYAKEV